MCIAQNAKGTKSYILKGSLPPNPFTVLLPSQSQFPYQRPPDLPAVFILHTFTSLCTHSHAHQWRYCIHTLTLRFSH